MKDENLNRSAPFKRKEKLRYTIDIRNTRATAAPQDLRLVLAKLLSVLSLFVRTLPLTFPKV